MRILQQTDSDVTANSSCDVYVDIEIQLDVNFQTSLHVFVEMFQTKACIVVLLASRTCGSSCRVGNTSHCFGGVAGIGCTLAAATGVDGAWCAVGVLARARGCSARTYSLPVVDMFELLWVRSGVLGGEGGSSGGWRLPLDFLRFDGVVGEARSSCVVRGRIVGWI
jgi:hypothetical protein